MNGVQNSISVQGFLKGSLEIFWMRRWVILGIMVFSLFLGFLAMQLLTPKFRSSATIQLDLLKLSSLSDEIIPTSFLADDLIVETEMQLLSSRGLAERVLENTKVVDVLAPNEDQEFKAQLAVKKLVQNVRVEREGKTALVRVYYSNSDPKLAALIADGYVTSYINFKRELQSKRMRDRRDFLIGELEKLNQRLKLAEAKSQEFATSTQLAIGNERTLLQMEEEMLKRDQIEKTIKLKTSEQNYQSLFSLLTNDMKPEQLQGAILVAQINPQIGFVQGEYTKTSLELSEIIALGKDLPAENSAIMRRLNALGNTLKEMVSGAIKSAKTEVDLSRETLENTIDDYHKVAQKIRISLVDQNQLRALKDAETAIKTQYDNLNAQLETIWSQSDFFRSPAEQISNSIPAKNPFSPNPKKIYLSALALGIFFSGLMLLIARQIFSRVEITADLLPSKDNVVLKFSKNIFGQKILEKWISQIPTPQILVNHFLQASGSGARIIGVSTVSSCSLCTEFYLQILEPVKACGYSVALLSARENASLIHLVNPKKNPKDKSIITHIKIPANRAEIAKAVAEIKSKYDLIFLDLGDIGHAISLPASVNFCEEICLLVQAGKENRDQTHKLLASLMGAHHAPIISILLP